ncbi:MAG: hypothetical protein Q7T61_20805 [Caulobacter sp.]|nr:hypothetical protein [Caulobacter sp.]
MIARRLLLALGLAALFLGVVAVVKYGESRGMVSPDIAKRTTQVLIGLGLAAYANLMPKQLSDQVRSPRAEAAAQAALRVGGWSLTLAGLAYAGLWAFAPWSMADTAATIVLAVATAVTALYAAWTFATCRAARA